MERAVRRAQVPFAVTQGFSPHMRSVFGWALPVGTGSCEEFLDVMTTDYVPAPELLERLQEAAPPLLAVSDVSYVDVRAPAPTEYYTVSRYEVLVAGVGAHELEEALTATVADGTLTVMRKKGERHLDLHQMVVGIPRCDTDDRGMTRIMLATRVTSQGCLRPEQLLSAAFSALPDDCAPTIVQLMRIAQEHEED